MADVAENVKEAKPVEKEVEKVEKVVDLEEEDKSNDEVQVQENGDSEKNGDAKAETNGSNGVSKETSSNKRKSGAEDAPDGTVEGTPEKKAKVTAAAEVESEESNTTNGSTEVTA